jgi:Mrp family chromosome partitioning ATPase
VTDAAPLARLADVSIFLVRWAETPRELVAMALKQLASYGAKIAGVVLTQVDMDKYAKYGENYRAYNSYYR